MGHLDAASTSSSPLSAFHAAVLDLAGLLERPLVPPAGAEVHAHGAPASVAVKPHHSHHHHSSTARSGSESSGSDDDRRSSSSGSGGSGGRSDDFEGLNFAQVRVHNAVLLSLLNLKPKELPVTRQRGDAFSRRKTISFFFFPPTLLAPPPPLLSAPFFCSLSLFPTPPQNNSTCSPAPRRG